MLAWRGYLPRIEETEPAGAARGLGLFFCGAPSCERQDQHDERHEEQGRGT